MSIAPVASVPSGSAPAATGGAGASFRAVLHLINPLQYLPVVGTIYRAVTGDTIPEGAQIAGSLAVGFAISGPVGLVTGIAAIIAEKATGIDPDKILHRVAVNLGLATDRPSVQIAAPVQTTPPPAAPSVPATNLATLSETERLNAGELERIRLAGAAYAKAAALG